MRAFVYHEYGSVDALAIADVPTPKPGPKEVRIAIHAAAVNPIDWHFLTGEPAMVRMLAGLRKPRRTVLGVDIAGHIDAVGEAVTRISPGHRVFCMLFDHGGFAESVCVPEGHVVPLADGLLFSDAAAVPSAGVCALQGLRDHAKVARGMHVLINGASGGVGTFAVQIAKTLGAEVTGVCSAQNLEMVASIGADAVIDYTKEDFAAASGRYDAIFDVAGTRTFGECQAALRAGGTYVTTEFSPFAAVRGKWSSALGGKRMIAMLTKRNVSDLEVLSDMLERRAIAPVIDTIYPFESLPDALTQVGKGHARGKVVISVRES